MLQRDSFEIRRSKGLLATVIFVMLMTNHTLVGLYLKDPLRLSQQQLSRCSPELLHFRRYRYLSHLCRRQPEVGVTAVHGLQEAVRECQNQMKYNRWDCTQSHPTDSKSYTILHQPPIIKYGYRESAFLISLSSAGVAWSVARSCAAGIISSCACDVYQHSSQQSWEWGGCSYSVKFGLITSRRLLSPKRHPRKTGGLLRKIHKHNLKAGRLAVKKTVAKACKCHGMSGSCQIKTCWKATADLEGIGRHLKKKFETAKFLLQHNSPNESRQEIQKVKSANLVYTAESPDFCRPMSYLKTPGTSGRACNVRNETVNEGDCDYLCCNQGYYVQLKNYTENCNCRFHWCCHVTCDKCPKVRWVSTCK